MKKSNHIFTFSIVLSLLFGFAFPLFAQEGTGKPSNKAVNQKIGKLQIPFIANEGQADKKVAFYANTFGGTVFVTNEGEIVYSLPKGSKVESAELRVESSDCRDELRASKMIHDARRRIQDNRESCIKSCRLDEACPEPVKRPCPEPIEWACPEPVEWTERTQQINDLHSPTSNSQTHNSKLVNSKLQGIALKETLIGAKVKEIKGEDKSVTKVNYFRGNDQKKWKSNISTYDVVDLGEVYNGIELKLKAYGNNVEKLFHIKPGADPDQIKINLSGIQPPDSKEKGEAAFPFIDRQPPESPFAKGDLVVSPSTIGSTDASQHSTTKPLTLKESITKSPSTKGRLAKSPLEKGGRGVVSPDESRASGLWINEQGQLVAETELGPVTFTKPVAYQEIDGKRVDVAVEYEIYAVPQVVHRKKPVLTSGRNAKNAKESIVVNTESAGNVCPPLAGVKGVERDSPHVIQPTTNPKSKIVNLSSTEIGGPKLEYGFKVASYDKTKELVIDPLLASTFLGGSGRESIESMVIDASGNVYVVGDTSSSDFPSTDGAYNAISNNGGDLFISKLSDDLGSLLASTYLGGSDGDYAASIAIDSSRNVYVTGYTDSSDFPTTTNAYDAYRYAREAFVSKLSGDLGSLIASTYLGGSSNDYGAFLMIDSNGNVIVTGTSSSDFPITEGAYDTDATGNSQYIFISIFDSNLSSIIASTLLGGSKEDSVASLVIDSTGSVYVTGYTYSSDFPTTDGSYDSTYNNDVDTFVSKLSGDLGSLIASTYLGGSDEEQSKTLTLNSNGDVYIAGYTYSVDFPTTEGAYKTVNPSYGDSDAFVLKLSNDLKSLIASTYLGENSRAESLVIDVDDNVYVAGYTYSSDFPTTDGSYDFTYNDNNSGSSGDTFISKLNSDLSDLITSTYFGGDNSDVARSMVIDEYGNIYIAGETQTEDLLITSGTYDKSYNGIEDVFIIIFDSALSASPPSVTTDSATDITINSATLNGTANANNYSTTAWFEYGLYSGLYDYSTSTKTVIGSSDQTISINISNLYAGTKYYYKIVAENNVGTAYGDEMSFTTLSDTTKPSGSININSGNSYTSSANVTLKLSASDDVGITGYYISTNSSTPSSSSSGWTSISSTTSYSASISYTLDGGDGSKTIYVWYKDGGGNISNTHSDSITVDTTPPEINITSPTSNDTYSTNISVVSVWGNASDATSGISAVKWENNKGGSGTASGTTSWSISNIGLLVDAENIITVTTTDNAGNSASDSITVTYSELTAEPTTIPTATATPTPKATPTELGAILGSVVDTDGKPVANATVFTDKGGYSAKTGSNGIYQLNDVAEGSYLLTALAEGYGSVSQTVTVKAGETTKADFALLRAITPPTPVPPVSPSFSPVPSTTPTPSTLSSKIFGYVMDEIDNPVKKAKVRCKGKNTKVKENATTNKQGYFEFNNLSADSYKITAKKKGFNKSKYNVNLEEGEEKEIEIVLEEK